MKWLRKRGTLFIAIVVLAVALVSGCISEGKTLRVGEPVPGDVYVYRAADGSQMTVTVLGFADRSDGIQRVHPSQILEYRWKAAGPEAVEVPMQEAVSVESGVHVRHDVLCDMNTASWVCSGQQEIFFGPYGLAGGLGLAPWWGEELRAGKIPMTSGVLQGNATFTVDAEWTSRGGLECLRIGAASTDVLPVGAWKPVTSAVGPRVLCEGEALPREWTPDQSLPKFLVSGDVRPVYELVEMRHLDVVPEMGGSQPPAHISREEVSGPLALLPTAQPLGGFDARMAHDKAVALDKGYAQFIGDSDLSIVVDAEFQSGGAAWNLLSREDYTTWRIVVAHPDGTQYQVIVKEARSTETLGSPTTKYSIEQSGALSEVLAVVPDPRDLEASTSNLAYTYGEIVLHQKPNLAYHAFRIRDGEWERQESVDRFTSRTLYEPPDTPPDATRVHPYIIQSDSKTGWITYVRLSPELRLSA